MVQYDGNDAQEPGARTMTPAHYIQMVRGLIQLNCISEIPKRCPIAMSKLGLQANLIHPDLSLGSRVFRERGTGAGCKGDDTRSLYSGGPGSNTVTRH